MHGTGKTLRLNRILDGTTRRAVIIPMDHGVSSGPIEGLVDLHGTIRKVAEGGATAVVLHKGILQGLPPGCMGRTGVILHLSASTGLGGAPDSKTTVSTVEDALRLGADAVSVQVNLGAPTEAGMLQDLGTVAGECLKWGVPLLAMAYPRGPGIKNQFDVDVVKHAARVAAELGADIVKTNYTGTPQSFREVVRGCTVPVVIAGGPRMKSDAEVLRMVQESVEAGGAGVSIGRNVFQHPNVAGMTRAIARIVISNLSVEDAYKEIGQ